MPHLCEILPGGGIGPDAPLLAGGVLLVAAAAFAARTVGEAKRREARPGIREITRSLREHPAVLVPLAFAFADRFTVGFFATTFSLYVTRIYDLASAQIGLAIATFMIPFALLSYPFGRLADRRSQIALLCGGSLLYRLGTAGIGFAAPPALYGLMFGIDITAAVMFVPSMLMTIRIAPDSIRATALGAFNAGGSLGFVIGSIAAVRSAKRWPHSTIGSRAIAPLSPRREPAKPSASRSRYPCCSACAARAASREPVRELQYLPSSTGSFSIHTAPS